MRLVLFVGVDGEIHGDLLDWREFSSYQLLYDRAFCLEAVIFIHH